MTDHSQAMTAKYRQDYRAPLYWIDSIDLDFQLQEPLTRVTAISRLRRNGEHNEPLVLAFIQDITERKENEARIDFLAHHDPLTGLPNRVLVRDRFALAMAWSERSGCKVALRICRR